MPNRQQELADKAYRIVNGRRGETAAKEYRSVCQSFPAMIHNSGLCQAVAFAEAKGRSDRDEMKMYLDDLAQMLGSQRDEFASLVRGAGTTEYQRLTREALAAATWLKRYAEALIERE